MQNPPSPLDTLRQLKEMLDAGALTPAEFEALKQRLVFEAPANTPATPAPAAPEVPVAPQASFVAPAYSEPIPVTLEELPASAVPYETVAPAYSAEPLPTEPVPAPAWQTSDEFPADMVEAPARNPLALILSIGGVLVFLAVVAYLSFNQPPSERVSSTSMTAADSAATVIETGPQAEPLPQSAAVPETVRVAPTNPAPPTQPRPARAVSDSIATPAPAAVQDSAAGQ
ncbi:SHOCT domain-containing protein [Hymenobacter antarcticus]|uniref:SHOCT domain-containing protein n=1 Tax=Hymenobacter antarcticus TaxID=486270 RepID=A0ABP7Q1T1_9BACT